jgi:oxygen-independent coproporphyrinogen-3 oxidase
LNDRIDYEQEHEGIAMTSGGVYIHWPFCERKCPYCDFHTFGGEHPNAGLSAEYHAALIRDIESLGEFLGWDEPARVDTVYFGGGTPGLMGGRFLEKLMRRLEQVFRISAEAEITIEINPVMAEVIELEEMLGSGINRVSIGCQSFQDRLLEKLGRLHDSATTRRSIDHLRELNVRNLSMDLMFGIPSQTMDEFRDDLEVLLSHRPEHVSIYNLTIHAGTPYGRWYREGRLRLPDESEQVVMFEMLMDRLGEEGFEHYEISNWCRPGMQSQHNSKYWCECDLFAAGASAQGVFRGMRFENLRDLKKYINHDASEIRVPVSGPARGRSRTGEIMMLALRRVQGVSWTELDAWSGCEIRGVYESELIGLLDEGLIETDSNGLKPTRRGILLNDSVALRFF